MRSRDAQSSDALASFPHPCSNPECISVQFMHSEILNPFNLYSARKFDGKGGNERNFGLVILISIENEQRKG